MKQDIRVELTSAKKPKPDPITLRSAEFSPTICLLWITTPIKDGMIRELSLIQSISMDPAAMVYHYGQTVFEGLKAYVTKDQEVLLFRPEKNMERLNQSNDRLCIPLIDEELVLEGLKQLVAIDQDWIPKAEGTSLYIRPFIIATEPFLGVAASHTYKLFIILSRSALITKKALNR